MDLSIYSIFFLPEVVARATPNCKSSAPFHARCRRPYGRGQTAPWRHSSMTPRSMPSPHPFSPPLARGAQRATIRAGSSAKRSSAKRNPRRARAASSICIGTRLIDQHLHQPLLSFAPRLLLQEPLTGPLLQAGARASPLLGRI